MLAALALTLGFSSSPAFPPSRLPALSGPCDLLDKATASQLLGKPVASAEPSGPEPDEESGATRTVCTYMSGQSMLIVMQLAFKTPAAASQATTKELVAQQLGEENAEGEKDADDRDADDRDAAENGDDPGDLTIEEASGLGDKSYRAYNPIGANYIVLKGSKVLLLSLGGTGKDPKSYKTSLRSAAASVVPKM